MSESQFLLPALRGAGTATAAHVVSDVPPLYFTVIQDATSSTAATAVAESTNFSAGASQSRSRTLHPRVHYIFNDDVEDMDYMSPFLAAAASSEDGVDRRSLIIDFAEDATTIVGATSLSPDWQVTKAEISSLAMRANSGSHRGSDIGKMLTIEGVGSSVFNRKVVSSSVYGQRRSGVPHDAGLNVEDELAGASAYSELFYQTNIRLKSLIDDSPPQQYSDLLEQLQSALPQSKTSAAEPESAAEPSAVPSSHMQRQTSTNPYGLQSTFMQQSIRALATPTSPRQDSLPLLRSRLAASSHIGAHSGHRLSDSESKSEDDEEDENELAEREAREEEERPIFAGVVNDTESSPKASETEVATITPLRDEHGSTEDDLTHDMANTTLEPDGAVVSLQHSQPQDALPESAIEESDSPSQTFTHDA
ncbi:uncharacterized protein V1518DRAFT_430748 [Limtongia smithiae]|uniref:uncharacterized protein n=1 Tax=Limtongia smithiae TaxID=1125753 RepID=UPI0034CDAA90